MMRPLFSRLFAITSGALLLLAGVQQASAQTYVPAPPETGEVDGNGVHLPTGDLLAARGGVSIGPADHQGLSFSQQYVDMGWRHAQVPSMSGSTTYPVVSFMGTTVSFVPNGSGGYKPAYENGATLSANRSLYTAPDGTQIIFSAPGNVESYYPAESNLAYTYKVIFTDGVSWTYDYQTASWTSARGDTFYFRRLSSIASNTGYQIQLFYVSNTTGGAVSIPWHKLASAVAFNSAVDYCGPIATTCSFSQAWPTVTFQSANINPTSETHVDPAGDTISYTYSSGRLTSIRRPGVSVDTVAFTYDGSNRVQTSAAAGVTSTYTYGSGTSSVATPGTAGASIVFNTSGQTNSRTVASQTSNFTYCTVDDSTCRIGMLRTAETPEGQTTTYSYNARGLVTQTVVTDSADANPITTSATYAASCTNPVTCNKPESTTDATGQTTNYTYNATHGGVTQVQLPAAAAGQPRPTINVTYANYFAKAKNSAGTLVAFPTAITLPTGSTRCRTAATCAGTVNEEVNTITYNNATQPNLLPVSATTKLGNNTQIATTALTYNNLGQVLTVDGPITGTTDMVYNSYDAAGRPIGSISADPDGAGALPRLASRVTYTNGLVTAQESGTVTGTDATALANMTVDQRVDTVHDLYGRPVVQRHRAPGSGTAQYSVTQTSFDAAGRVDCTVQRMSAPLVATVLPGAPTANLAVTTNAGLVCDPMAAGANGPDRISKNIYDANGRLTTVQSGVGTGLVQNTQTFGYRTAANQNGQLDWVQDAEGNRTGYDYDAFGRLIRTNYPSPTTDNMPNIGDYDQVTFDAFGRVSSFLTRAGESFTFAFDNLNRVTSVNVPTRAGLAATHTRDVFYGYDLFGNMEYARFDSASGEGVTNTWNALGQLASSTTNMDAISRTVSYTYNAAGQFTHLTYPDTQAFNYTYDPLNRLKTLRNPALNTLITWNYNAQGRIGTRVADSAAPDTTYSYDPAGRLSGMLFDHGVGTAYDANYSWTFNPASQIASETQTNDSFAFNAFINTNIDYVIDGLNRYTSTNPGSGPITYGYDANSNLTSDGTTTFTYDTENRLVSSVNASGTVTLRYDPLGRLYEVTAANGGKRRLYYSGQDLIAEYDGAGVMLNRYVHGLGGGDDPLVQFNGSSVALADTFFLNTDMRGSVVLVTKRSGTPTNLNTYDEYGVPGVGNTGRFGFTGQTWLPELGLWYYKARMYSPTLGRFMQTDPIGYGDGMNMYAYVGGDPVNGVDPTGMVCLQRTTTWYFVPRFGVDSNGNGGEPGEPREVDREKSFIGECGGAWLTQAGGKTFGLDGGGGGRGGWGGRILSQGAAEEELRETQENNCAESGIGNIVHNSGEISRNIVQIQANHSITGNEWGFVANSKGEVLTGISEGEPMAWDAPIWVRVKQRLHRAGNLIVFHSHSNPGLSKADINLGNHATNSLGFGEPISVAVSGGKLFCSRPAF